jgi:hypothetical protein
MKNKTWCLLGLTLIAAVIVTAEQNPPIVPSDEGCPEGPGKNVTVEASRLQQDRATARGRRRDVAPSTRETIPPRLALIDVVQHPDIAS